MAAEFSGCRRKIPLLFRECLKTVRSIYAHCSLGGFAFQGFQRGASPIRRCSQPTMSSLDLAGLRGGLASYCAVYPPSTVMSWPVMNAAPGEPSQSTAPAISSGVPMRPTGVCVAIVFFISVSPSPKARSNISVWIGPGETLLTRTPCLANSSAAVLVRPMTANLLAT